MELDPRKNIFEIPSKGYISPKKIKNLAKTPFFVMSMLELYYPIKCRQNLNIFLIFLKKLLSSHFMCSFFFLVRAKSNVILETIYLIFFISFLTTQISNNNFIP